MKLLQTENKNKEYISKIAYLENQLQQATKNLNEQNNIINKINEENQQKELQLKNYQNQVEKYNMELNNTKILLGKKNEKNIEVELKLKEELENRYSQLYQEEIKSTIKNINKNIQEHEKYLQKQYENYYKELENNYIQKFSQVSNLMLQNENNNKKNKCNTVHNGIKCNKCFKEPIVGYRYKCSICNNYNLCEECEEKNEQSGEHQHEFIKMRKHVTYNMNNINNNYNNFQGNNIPINNNNNNPIHNMNNFNKNFVDINDINNNNHFQGNNAHINNNNNHINDDDFNLLNNNNQGINNKNNNNNFIQIKNFNINNNKRNNADNNDFELFQFGEQYSFECLNEQNLQHEIEEGEDITNMEIIIKNNGINQWPINGAKLVSDDQKNIKGEDIFLEPQKQNEEKKYIANFRDLKNYPAGNYNAGYYFEINGKKYGDDININLIIKEKKPNNDDNDYQVIINEFRSDFSLDKNEYSDEKLLEVLKKNNFDKSEAFSSLFE